MGLLQDFGRDKLLERLDKGSTPTPGTLTSLFASSFQELFLRTWATTKPKMAEEQFFSRLLAMNLVSPIAE
jgi:tRNA(His) 5'-end guanylyltransferase